MSPSAEPGRSASPCVAYILKMFPRLSETFILNEVLELEAAGLGLWIFSLRTPVDAVVHEQAQRVRSPITYLPQRLSEGPLRLARAQLVVWRRHRRNWRHTLRQALRHARASGDWDDLLVFAQACCIVREMGPIRHLHAHYANLPAKVALLVHRLTGASYSVSTHAKDIFQNKPFGSAKLRDRLTKASFVIANSEFSARHIRAGLNDLGDIRTVYNGLDLTSFPRRGSEPERPLILGVGRLVEKKGFGDLVTACRRLHEQGVTFACEIVGTGPLSSSLKEQIRSAGLNQVIQLTGPLPQQALREHYRRARVFVLPCKRAPDGYRDILPNVVKEAMAVGVPVLTTRLEGIEELVEDEVTGLLVEPGNPGALAQQLERLLADAPLRQRLADKAREVIETRFDRRTTVVQLKGFLETAARESACQTPRDQTTMPEPYHASCVR